ncbi:MAG: DUF4423 domain-containing protein [Bdellovibrionaceae bacterium]|nr:DUF4423 domain-containing protein [Pseudobdellovibrionaceae bacterium]
MLQQGSEGNLNITKKNTDDDFNNLVEDFYNNITWRQLHALLTLKPISASPNNVATLFNIPLDEAVDAIEGLFSLGLLIKNGDTYVAGKKQFLIPDNLNTRENRTSEHVNQSRQILNKVDSTLDFGAWTHYLAASKEDMHWFRSEFKKLILELESRVTNNNQNELYTLTYTDVPTSINTEGEQG